MFAIPKRALFLFLFVALAVGLNAQTMQGPIAQKPAGSDAVQFVSVNGNDSNDGLSWGTAKATLAAAIGALPANGGTVQVASGTYTVSASVTFISGVDLECATNAKIQSVASGAFQILNGGTSASPLSNVTIRGCTIDGASSTSVNQQGINLVGSNILIAQNVIQNVGAYGIAVNGPSSPIQTNVRVVGNVVKNAGLSTAAGTQFFGITVTNVSNTLIQSNDVSGSGLTTGVNVFGSINPNAASPVLNNRIVNNVVHNIGPNANNVGGTGIDAGRNNGLVIVGNQVSNISSGGAGDGIILESVWNATVSSNTLLSTCTSGQQAILSKTPDTTQAGEQVPTNISISGNTILQTSSFCAAIITINGAWQNVAISDNSVVLNTTGGINTIFLQGGGALTNVTVVTQGVTVKGNTLFNQASLVSNTSQGISFNETGTLSIVQSNEVSDNILSGFNNAIGWQAAQASGVGTTYLHDNSMTGNNNSVVDVDGKAYATVYWWRNDPMNGGNNTDNPIPNSFGPIRVSAANAGSNPGILTTANTATRTYTLPDATGTLALVPLTGSVGGSTTLLAANTCGDAVTQTITGATTTMVATASPQAAISAGLILSTPFVSAANTVTVGYCNVTTAGITPAAATFNIRVIQ